MKFYTSKENRLTFVVSNNELKDENFFGMIIDPHSTLFYYLEEQAYPGM